MTTVDRNRLRLFETFHELVPGGELQPQWKSDGSGFCVLVGDTGAAQFVEVEPGTGVATPLIDPMRVRKGMNALGIKPPPGTGMPGSQFRLVAGDAAVEFSYADRWFSVEIPTGEVTELSLAEANRRSLVTPREVRKTFLGPRVPVMEVADPAGQFLLTEKDRNLWLRCIADDRLQQLTSDDDPDVAWTVEGAQWAPDGQTVAAIRTDSAGVDRLPIVHWLKPLEEVEWLPYTKSGARAAVRSLNLVDVNGGVVPIDLGRPGDDLSVLLPVTWHASGELLFLVSDRINKVLELRAADRRTGASRLIVAERQETFVYGIRFDAILSSAVPTPDGRLIWFSERDGWRHAYLYDVDGTEQCRLTAGPFEVERVCGFGPEVVYLLARSDIERPYDVHACRVGIDGMGFTQLTSAPGTHSPVVSPNGAVIIDRHSHINRPPRTDLLRSDGTLVTTLATADSSALDELGYFPPEEFTVSALDGTTTLHGLLYKPPGFDPSRRYPLVEYIYGGPQVLMNATAFHAPSLARLLAAVGFVTFVVDGPGTPGRGKAFQDAAYGRFGQYEIDEHANVVRQLLERYRFLDGDRVGLTGGSWGGYHTVRALLSASETYHVGVGFFPVADCLDHIGAAIEPYLGLPADNQQAYAAASSLGLVDRLRGRLLLIHGTSDVNAPYSATMRLVDAFIRAERPVDLLVVPELDHSTEGQRGRYAVEQAVDYLAEHLAVGR